MTTAPIVIAAGGTGGHVFPAQALAHSLAARGRTLAFVTDQRGGAFDEGWPKAEVFTLRSGAVAGRGPLARLKGLLDVMRGARQAQSLFSRLKPAAVVGFGGYPSVPPVLAGSRLGRPTLIHEANAVLGRANRFLAPRATAIATAFPRADGLKAGLQGKVTVTGNPVRPAAVDARGVPYAEPKAGGEFRLVVFGGSLGATVFSRVVPDALAALPENVRMRLKVVQQCRMEDYAAARDIYERAGIHAELASFFGDMPARIANAHLVVARAGASTVAELAVIGRPAILVPYPHAIDDHQTVNAHALATVGGGWPMAESSFTPEAVTAMVGELIEAPERLAEVAAAARSLGRPDAAERLADVVERIARDEP
ncbi:MAG: undecaprenyldiphospho-muramoylpentapeptide beta-N-acetylglucosaminyltransferase [Rhodospirillaceae bacterium]|nr:undecaprenyldiphospho-muramoylpentapeptide beta-N-acetylglucosaminyltransferase [Rhodospirillaceae bacterium]